MLAALCALGALQYVVVVPLLTGWLSFLWLARTVGGIAILALLPWYLPVAGWPILLFTLLLAVLLRGPQRHVSRPDRRWLYRPWGGGVLDADRPQGCRTTSIPASRAPAHGVSQPPARLAA
jgi:hypothetical protein